MAAGAKVVAILWAMFGTAMFELECSVFIAYLLTATDFNWVQFTVDVFFG
jgi:hypothetical protein